jgi:two-component system, LytTR family, response regulator
METQCYKAVIVDDEEDARELIALFLQSYFPSIDVVDKTSSVAGGARSIALHKPDIVFLDIEMGDGNGFDLLKRLPDFKGLVIFITAYDNYAIKAIKASAMDYLLKPLNSEEFREAVTKTLAKLGQSETRRRETTHLPEVRKIGIPNYAGYSYVEVSTIVRCEADGNYTALHFTKAPRAVVSRSLSYFENELKKYGFLRVHHKHLVNLNHVVNYSKGKSGGHVTMSDGVQLEVSVRKKPLLIKALALAG